jgi:hypothetical protein
MRIAVNWPCPAHCVASWEEDTEEKAMDMQRKIKPNDELERLRRRYAGLAKEGQGRLLDEFCEHHAHPAQDEVRQRCGRT